MTIYRLLDANFFSLYYHGFIIKLDGVVVAMVGLDFYNIIEIVTGVIVFWIGLYFFSRNPYSSLSKIVFSVLTGLTIIMVTDPIHVNTRSLQEYVFWQKVLDIPVVFNIILFYHASCLIKKYKSLHNNYILIIGYLIAISISIIDLSTDLIMSRQIRSDSFRFSSVLDAGSFLWILLLYGYVYIGLSARNYYLKNKEIPNHYILPFWSSIICIFAITTKGPSYYFNVPYANIIFIFEVLLVCLMLVYPMIRYHIYSEIEGPIFDREFFYKTLVMFLIVALYLILFFAVKMPFGFTGLVFIVFLMLLLLFTHSFYDWLSTFINDFLYNPTTGFSVVNDQEVYQVLRNYHSLGRLEDSPLLRLNILNKKIHQDKSRLPIDMLRETIREAVDYFKPTEEPYRRTKQNLKYQLLKMLVFDEAEEGQMLWELGFDEYPTKIMSGNTEKRQPIFARFYPSDYTYTSRNAFLALKKEAIHDIAWRISYLEKLVKKKSF